MTLQQGLDIGVVLALVLALNTGILSLVMFILSRTSGWRKLAAEFPGREPAAGALGGVATVTFHTMSNYGNCIVWKADEEFLHLRVVRLLSIYHPPMSIPWAAVQIVDGRGRWGKARIEVLGIPMKVPARMVQREVQLRAELESAGV